MISKHLCPLEASTPQPAVSFGQGNHGREEENLDAFKKGVQTAAVLERQSYFYYQTHHIYLSDDNSMFSFIPYQLPCSR